jgi:GMP synthase (glutamine-hydrolysing)
VICFVDIEHQKVLEDPAQRPGHLASWTEWAMRLEAIAGVPCLLEHYTRITRERLRRWGIRALCLSGNVSEWLEYSDADLAEMYRVIQAAEIPIIGFCGGCQLIAMACGAPVGPIRRLCPGETLPYPNRTPGYYRERGFMPVHVTRPDSLFAGQGEQPIFFESHYWEVKRLPRDFEALASTDECRIQAMRRRDRPVYGVQFHPEQYTEEYPDGKRLLANFFCLARLME